MVRYKAELSHGEVEFTAETLEALAWAEHVTPEEGARPAR